MNALAVIPARGGSKRLPRKNIADFAGKPIIVYTVEAARRARLFSRILVSTEDDEIAGIAGTFGTEVDRRPISLAGDEATVNEVLIDLLKRERRAGREYDLLCCLYATSPLRNHEDIRRTADLVEPGRCESAIAVTSYELPPHQALKSSDDGVLTPMWPDLIEKRESEIGQLLVDNGSTYASTTKAFLRNRTFYSNGMKGYCMPRERSVDIDTAEDFELALHYAGKHLK